MAYLKLPPDLIIICRVCAPFGLRNLKASSGTICEMIPRSNFGMLMHFGDVRYWQSIPEDSATLTDHINTYVSVLSYCEYKQYLSIMH